MIDKICPSADAAIAGLADGATVLLGGFGAAGSPVVLIDAVLRHGARDLTIVTNNAGDGTSGLVHLLKERRVRKLICSFPRSFDNSVFADLYTAGAIELELVPQGTLAERIRAGGAGVPAFYTPTGAQSELRAGCEVRDFNGAPHVLEHAIKGDFALIKADSADRWGNLRYRKAARNFGPVMATAAATVVAQVREVYAAAADVYAWSHGTDLFALMDAAEDLVRPLQDRPVRVDRETLSRGYAGVYSSFFRHAEKAAAEHGLDTRAIRIELGRRKMVGGQEDMIVDVALDMAAAAKAAWTGFAVGPRRTRQQYVQHHRERSDAASISAAGIGGAPV